MELWNKSRPWIGLLARLGLGIVWIVAAVDKLGSPRTFVQAVRAYNATPEWLSEAIGYGLPVLELCVGVLLVLGLVTRITAAVAGLLFVVFLIGIIQAAARGIQLDCGCFGGGGATSNGTTYTLDILRDIGLLILAAYLVLWPATRWGVDEFLARNDDVAAPSAKRMRSDKGRAKYNAMLEARRKEAQSRTLWTSISISVLVVLISVVGIGVQSGRAKIEGSLVAAHATVADGVVYGSASAPAKVDVFEDFQCPICLQFEQSAQKTVDAAVASGKAQVRFHIMDFLDSHSTNNYSSRAANAALCASDVSVADFVRYHNLLYGKYDGKQVQNTEGTAGPTDDDLVAYGKAIGLTSDQLTTFTSCVDTQQHKALVEALLDQASKDGVTGTPTIKVNGKSVNATADDFTKAIDAAVAAAAKKGTTVTPIPAASVAGSVTPSAAASSSVAPSGSPSGTGTPTPTVSPSEPASSASPKASSVG